MNPDNIRSGWWVSVNNEFTGARFVCCYDTEEEAKEHIRFQKEEMHSTAIWWYDYIQIKLMKHGN